MRSGLASLTLVWTVAGCLSTPGVECGEVICPAGTQCSAVGCVADEQLNACAGLIDGDRCATTQLLIGRCDQGVCAAACGDGVVRAEDGELCEPGVTLTDACTDLGFDAGTLTCSASCAYDPTACHQFGWQRVAGFEPRELAVLDADRLVMIEGGALRVLDEQTLQASAWGQVEPTFDLRGLGVGPNGEVVAVGERRDNSRPIIAWISPDGSTTTVDELPGLVGTLGDVEVLADALILGGEEGVFRAPRDNLAAAVLLDPRPMLFAGYRQNLFVRDGDRIAWGAGPTAVVWDGASITERTWITTRSVNICDLAFAEDGALMSLMEGAGDDSGLAWFGDAVTSHYVDYNGCGGLGRHGDDVLVNAGRTSWVRARGLFGRVFPGELGPVLNTARATYSYATGLYRYFPSGWRRYEHEVLSTQFTDLGDTHFKHMSTFAGASLAFNEEHLFRWDDTGLVRIGSPPDVDVGCFVSAQASYLRRDRTLAFCQDGVCGDVANAGEWLELTCSGNVAYGIKQAIDGPPELTRFDGTAAFTAQAITADEVAIHPAVEGGVYAVVATNGQHTIERIDPVGQRSAIETVAQTRAPVLWSCAPGTYVRDGIGDLVMVDGSGLTHIRLPTSDRVLTMAGANCDDFFAIGPGTVYHVVDRVATPVRTPFDDLADIRGASYTGGALRLMTVEALSELRLEPATPSP